VGVGKESKRSMGQDERIASTCPPFLMKKENFGKRFKWYSPCKKCKHNKKKDCHCGIQLRSEWMQKQRLNPITWKK